MAGKTNHFLRRGRMLAAACLLLLSGCRAAGSLSGGRAEPETEKAPDPLITVGFSQLGSESVWRSANTVSIQETLTEENGYFLIYQNARQKQENQIKAIRSFISQQVDVIVFSPVVEEGWDTVLLEAKNAGIPVIVSDRQVRTENQDLVTAWVGGDMELEGEKAGKWLAENAGGSRELKIVVLTGTEGSSAAEGRTRGFRKIAAAREGWRILEEKCGDFTMARGREVMEYFLDTYPEIDVLVSQNDDMTFGAIEVLQERGIEPGKDLLIISFDAVKAALEMVRKGWINVDVECSPLLGPDLDRLIQAVCRQEAFSYENPVEEMVFTKENVEEYLDSRTY